MTDFTTNDAGLARLLQRAEEARRGGDVASATRLLKEVLKQEPENPAALNALGLQALDANDAQAARALFQRATVADPTAQPLLMNLATAYRVGQDDAAERETLERVLAIDQRHLMANVRLAELHDRCGNRDGAAFRWQGVVTMLQSATERPPVLDQLLARALERVAAHNAKFAGQVDGALDRLLTDVPKTDRRRFDACVDAMLGRRLVYHNACHGLHFPFLPADEFFERRHFPWLAEIEAATPAIRAEFEGLFARADSGFAPYVDLDAGTPDNKWTPLDRSKDWSARYLWRYGVRDDAVCARCPETAAMLERLPRADMAGRGPTAFFSVLKPGTRLPAHTGVSNVRAIVHLPLIVPEGCGFRVGGETREWRVSEAFVFDDTIEHEAWNDSREMRAVLIFDVWNPHLNDDERMMLRHLFETLGGLESAPATMGAVVD